MKTKICKNLAVVLVMTLFISSVALPAGYAASEVYVNDSDSTLGTDIGSAWAVGSGGDVSQVGDVYVITGTGTVKIGQTSTPGGLPSGEPDGSTIRVKNTVVRVGIFFPGGYSGSSAVSTVTLENYANSSGFRFGYYDSNRNFHETGSTDCTRIIISGGGGSTGAIVSDASTGGSLYSHTDGSNNLAVVPISGSGKAITKVVNKGSSDNTFYGGFEFFRYQGGASFTVINVLPLEDYIKGVVPIEMSPSWPREALKAQAVCARTYYAYYVAASPNAWSQYKFDITNDTRCQAYLGTARANSNSDAAVDETAGQYITYNNSLCAALYSSSCGGGTESNANVNGNNYHPYLAGVIDPYEAAAADVNPNNKWAPIVMTPAQLGGKVGLGAIDRVEPTYSPTNNCIKLVLTDTNGYSVTIERDACRTRLGMNSIHYTVTKNADGNFVFNGGGLGHNVGMSQYGAFAIARNYGGNYRQILRFYYTGVKISTGVQA